MGSLANSEDPDEMWHNLNKYENMQNPLHFEIGITFFFKFFSDFDNITTIYFV